MRVHENICVASPHVSLPSVAHAFSGYKFHPRRQRWVWRDAVLRIVLDFDSVKPWLSADLLHSLKVFMLWLAENRSPSSVHSDFDRFRSFFRFIASNRALPILEVSRSDVLNYRGSLPTSRQRNTIERLRTLLDRWHKMELSGVSSEAIEVLKSCRSKSPVRAPAVRSGDPKLGPFSAIEFEGLVATLNQRIAAGSLDEDCAVLAQLLIALGIRPVQCALLKVCDIQCEVYDGRPRFSLRVPQVKQARQKPRSCFRERALPESLGRGLYEHAQGVCARFKAILRDPTEAPLIPARVPGMSAVGYEWHSTSDDLHSRLRRALSHLKVYSERTGGRLNIAPVRFRRTFATRAAAAGWSAHAIAEALGHRDTQCVMVYVELIPDIAARIDHALAREMAPLAQAFAGKLIQNESEAIRGSDPTSRIYDARIDHRAEPLGSCGQFSFCAFGAPIACYTCQHFQPWLDGPHGAVRDYLLEKRAQLLATTSETVAAINDRCILAVEQVIQLCQDQRVKLGDAHG